MSGRTSLGEARPKLASIKLARDIFSCSFDVVSFSPVRRGVNRVLTLHIAKWRTRSCGSRNVSRDRDPLGRAACNANTILFQCDAWGKATGNQGTPLQDEAIGAHCTLRRQHRPLSQTQSTRQRKTCSAVLQRTRMCLMVEKPPRWTQQVTLEIGRRLLFSIGGSVVRIHEMAFKLAPTRASRLSLLESSKNVANGPSPN